MPKGIPTNAKVNGPSLIVRRLGPWEGANWQYKQLPKVIKAALLAEERKIANEIRRRVRGHIRNQDLPWKAASRSKKGDKLLYETGTYYDNIKVWQSSLVTYVGVQKHVIQPRSKKPVYLIAQIHERGSRRKGIPRRPLWRPTYLEMGGDVGIGSRMAAALRIATKKVDKNHVWKVTYRL